MDTTDAHSNRVSKLMLMIWPWLPPNSEVSEHLQVELIACIMHDAPEIVTGDVGNPTKRKYPSVKRGLVAAEEEWLKEAGFKLWESPLMKMLDLLDAVLFAKRHAYERWLQPDWQEDCNRCIQMAVSLKIGSLIEDMIRGA